RESADHGYTGPVAADYPDCLRIVEERVKPERMKYEPSSSWNKSIKARWWQFAAWRKYLLDAVGDSKTVLVRARVANVHSLVWLPSHWVCNEQTIVFVNCSFPILQSSIHECWMREYTSSLRTDVRYAPSGCFDTFPFAKSVPSLDVVSQRYYECRKQIM